MTNDNPLALLWHIDNPKNMERELDNAKKRFGQRPELADRIPEKVYFRPGEAPAQIPVELNGLQIIEADHVPPGGYFKLA